MNQYTEVWIDDKHVRPERFWCGLTRLMSIQQFGLWKYIQNISQAELWLDMFNVSPDVCIMDQHI
jgi:hypothetical protein